MLKSSLEGLSRDLQRILGVRLPDVQIEHLLELKPMSAQSLNRFLQTIRTLQLKKGQSDQVLHALVRARGRTAAHTPFPASSPPPIGDSSLSALATSEGTALAHALGSVFRDVHFDQVNRDLRLPRYGGDYDIRPFPLPVSPVDTHEMKRRLREAVRASRHSDDALLARRIQHAFSFFMFGEALHGAALEELLGPQRRATLDEGVRLGLFISCEGQTLRTNGLSLFSKALRNGEVIHLFADTPPHFETRTAQQRVYVGADSYELVERVSAMREISGCWAEMGSGSGIQLIAAVRQFPAIATAIGVERDRRAVHVSLFNAALNRVDHRIAVVSDVAGLRQTLEGKPLSFAMTNPPFLAMPECIDVDSQEGPLDLRTLFPEAGWGGDDGLAVTKQFIDALFPLLTRDSQVIIYSQFAGDLDGPSLLRDYIQARGGFHLAFESRRRLSATDAAASVARLIVAASMARDEPGRLRVRIRNDGPEHGLLIMCARRLEDSYRGQGVTHFHDGFGVLTRLEESSKGA